jgi:hypothetical protein
MSVGRKRPLAVEERIRLEEEEHHLRASRQLLENRLSSVKDELEAARTQQGQLMGHLQLLGNQVAAQGESRTRQLALQFELNKSLSKTRDAFLKVVTESMASGNLSRREGLAFILEESMKEILVFDTMDRPHASHRCRALHRTCLDLPHHFLDAARAVEEDQSGDPNTVLCPAYRQNGACLDTKCPLHQSGEPRISPQLDPLPDLALPEFRETPHGCLNAWWLDPFASRPAPVPLEPWTKTTFPLSMDSILHRCGCSLSEGDNLLIDNASSEETPVAVVVGRYMDGFRLCLHAGTVAGPPDLSYLLAALEDLSFKPHKVTRVKDCLDVLATLESPVTASNVFASHFDMHLRVLAAVDRVDAYQLSSQESSGEPHISEDWFETISRFGAFFSSLPSSKLKRREMVVITTALGQAVLRALKGAAERIHDRDQADSVELGRLYARIDSFLIRLLQEVCEEPFVHILLAPLFAGNIALACSLKLYETAYARLQFLLDVGRPDPPFQGLNLLMYSDLLWSQLVQLRSCLPSMDSSLDELADSRAKLVDWVDDTGIRLNHYCSVVGRVK